MSLNITFQCHWVSNNSLVKWSREVIIILMCFSKCEKWSQSLSSLVDPSFRKKGRKEVATHTFTCIFIHPLKCKLHADKRLFFSGNPVPKTVSDTYTYIQKIQRYIKRNKMKVTYCPQRSDHSLSPPTVLQWKKL